MKTHFCRLACVLFVLTIVLPSSIQAATLGFGPTPYLSSADRPAGIFCESCPLVLEDFEDGTYADSGITISDGRILEPFSVSGLENFVTDSVDADDGTIDGSGNAGHSWFFAGSSGDPRTFLPVQRDSRSSVPLWPSTAKCAEAFSLTLC